MKLNQFSQFKNNSARFREIITILSKYGLANWVKEKDPDFLNGLFTNAQGKSFAGLPFAQRLRMALTELGGTFIKLGQMLSTRADIVGPEIAEELAKLQSDVPADDEQSVRQTIEDELATSLESVYQAFDFNALGSASIGQVHAATLIDGQEVVVKVQHAGIEDNIRADIDILGLLAALAEKYDPELSLYQPKKLIRDFSHNLFKELDYAKELSHMELFRQNFSEQPQVVIPQVYQACSGKRVLTMQRLNGFSIGDQDKLLSSGADPKVLAQIGVNIYLDMVFRDAVFHADPHPGNIWVLPDNKIGLLDFGMVGRLDEDLQESVENLLMAVSQKDVREATYQITRICSAVKPIDRQLLQEDVGEFIFEYFSGSLQDVLLADVLLKLTAIIRAHHLILPTGVSELIRVLILLEGSSQLLDRRFSLNSAIEPYAHKMRMRRLHPKRVIKKMTRSLGAWERLLSSLPADLETMIEQMRRGDFDVNLKHRDLDAVINRLVYGVLTGAMLLGGSMLLSSKVPPLINDISIFGGAMLAGSAFLGLKLLRAISKSGDLVNKDK